MRILNINSYYSVSPFYRNLFDEQRALGDSVRVYVPVAKGYDAAGREFGEGVDLARTHGRYDRMLFHLKHGKILRDARARYLGKNFDLLHAHSLFSNGYIAHALSRAWGVPYVVAVRDTDVNVFFRRMPHLRALGRRLLADAERVIFLSPAYREEALKPFLDQAALRAVMDKSFVVPNGIDRIWLDQRGAAKSAPAPDRLRMLLVGQVIRRKNIPVAVEAARILRARGVNATLTVVGKPIDSKLARSLEGDPCVQLLAPRPMAELLPLYRSADLFVLPSVRETFGLVYAEAVSQALPVLYTRGQGFDGQFPAGEVGFPIDCRDPRDIADRAQDVLRDYAAISARCAMGCARFDWADIAQTYQGIYRDCARKTGQA